MTGVSYNGGGSNSPATDIYNTGNLSLGNNSLYLSNLWNARVVNMNQQEGITLDAGCGGDTLVNIGNTSTIINLSTNPVKIESSGCGRFSIKGPYICDDGAGHIQTNIPYSIQSGTQSLTISANGVTDTAVESGSAILSGGVATITFSTPFVSTPSITANYWTPSTVLGSLVPITTTTKGFIIESLSASKALNIRDSGTFYWIAVLRTQ